MFQFKFSLALRIYATRYWQISLTPPLVLRVFWVRRLLIQTAWLVQKWYRTLLLLCTISPLCSSPFHSRLLAQETHWSQSADGRNAPAFALPKLNIFLI